MLLEGLHGCPAVSAGFNEIFNQRFGSAAGVLQRNHTIGADGVINFFCEQVLCICGKLPET